MAGWRKVAETIRQGGEARHNSDNRHDSPEKGSNVPIVPNVPANPSRLVREWRASLARLSDALPPDGVEAVRWRRLCDDAGWLLDHFADQAARDGWTAADLFGVHLGADGWGGVADRLRGSRSLKMTSERAGWRRLINGEPEDYVRGVQPGLRALWELGE